MRNNRRAKTGALLIELLIMIAVFGLCAAACVTVIFTAANEMTYSERLTEATVIACDIAERFKSGEDAEALCEKEYPETYKVALNRRQEGGVIYLDISLSDEAREYVSITAARMGGALYEA